MQGMLARRMKRELELLSSGSAPGITAWPHESRLDRLEGEICGAEGTPYAGGVFRVEVTIPAEYPLKPPSVRFVTKIYHPNIDSEGRICLDTLNMPPKGAWKPSLNISTVLSSIQALMSTPNPDDGLMPDITDQFRRNPSAYQHTAALWTKRHATAAVDAIDVVSSARANEEQQKVSEQLAVQASGEHNAENAGKKPPSDVATEKAAAGTEPASASVKVTGRKELPVQRNRVSKRERDVLVSDSDCEAADGKDVVTVISDDEDKAHIPKISLEPHDTEAGAKGHSGEQVSASGAVHPPEQQTVAPVATRLRKGGSRQGQQAEVNSSSGTTSDVQKAQPKTAAAPAKPAGRLNRLRKRRK